MGSDRQAVAAFYPLAWVTERVAGDDWEVTNLTQPGGEPHDVELCTAQTADLDEAELVVFQYEFQPAVDDAIDKASAAVVVDAAEAVELRTLDEQHAETSTPAEEHAEGDGHDHGDVDPHFWQDPLRMADLADAVADALAEVDADGAATYRRNAAALRADLEALDAEFTDGPGGLRARHRRRQPRGVRLPRALRPALRGASPASPRTPSRRPPSWPARGPHRRRGYHDRLLRAPGQPRLAETLAVRPGVETAVLDPIEGLTDQTTSERLPCPHAAEPRGAPRANGC